jgi:acyl carrier protein
MTDKQEYTKNVLLWTISDFTKIPSKDISFTSKFVEDLGYDSLDSIETVMNLEDALNIEMDYDKTDDLKTVQDVYDYLLTCPKSKDSPASYTFFGDLSQESIEGSDSAEVGCGNNVTISIKEYDRQKDDTVFPVVLKDFKDKKVRVTIETIE